MQPLTYSTLAGLTEQSVRFIKHLVKTGDLTANQNTDKIAANAITAISVAIQADNHLNKNSTLKQQIQIW